MTLRSGWSPPTARGHRSWLPAFAYHCRKASGLVSTCTSRSPPIELILGFSLAGVGGLIGIHRTVDTEYLREGLRAKTLDSILFPDNAILNAPKILSDMAGAFPIAEGPFVIGPTRSRTRDAQPTARIAAIAAATLPMRLRRTRGGCTPGAQVRGGWVLFMWHLASAPAPIPQPHGRPRGAGPGSQPQSPEVSGLLAHRPRLSTSKVPRARETSG